MPGLDMMPNPDDHEAAMARADLYKLANYSFKLFKMVKDGDQLEGWVQAKITKAADYIASVYHFMEYEKKFSEYGETLNDSDVYTEEVRQQFKSKLMEAKVKLEKLREKNIKEVSEEMKVGDTKKSSTGGTIEKTKTGVKHTAKDYDGEDHTEPAQKKPSKAAKSAAEKKGDREADKAETKKSKDWQKRFGKGSVTKVDSGKKVKEAMAPMNPDGATAEPPKGKDGQYPVITSGPNKGKRWTAKAPGPTNPAFGAAKTKSHPVMPSRQVPVKEASKPDFLDVDKDGNKKEPMKKAIKDKKKSLDKK
jgi:hypothetical protein